MDTSTSFHWQFNDPKTSITYDTSNQFEDKYNYHSIPGTTKVYLSATNRNYPNFVSTDSMTITINSAPDVNCSLVHACKGDSVELINLTTLPIGNNDSISYLWKFGDGNTSTQKDVNHLYLNADSAEVKLIATANGCSDSLLKIAYVYPNPSPQFSHSASGKTVEFLASESGAVSYKWIFGDGDSSIVQNPTHIYADSILTSIACLTIVNTNCEAHFCDTISLMLSSNYEPKALNVFGYPNPVSDLYQIKGLPNNCTVQLSDIFGAEVITSHYQNEDTYFFNLKGLPIGTYIINAQSLEESYLFRIIVSR